MTLLPFFFFFFLKKKKKNEDYIKNLLIGIIYNLSKMDGCKIFILNT